MALLAFFSLLLFQAADLSGVRHAEPVPRDLAAPVAAAIKTNDAGLKSIVLEVPVTGGQLRFGLVLIGKIEA